MATATKHKEEVRKAVRRWPGRETDWYTRRFLEKEGVPEERTEAALSQLEEEGQVRRRVHHYGDWPARGKSTYWRLVDGK